MTIGNLNPDSFQMECIKCGRREALSLVAHRNTECVCGWIVVCPDCKDEVCGGYFQLFTTPKED